MNSCDQGPVVPSAMTLWPSQTISSQEYPPLSTSTVTTVSSGSAGSSSADGSAVSASVAASSAASSGSPSAPSSGSSSAVGAVASSCALGVTLFTSTVCVPWRGSPPRTHEPTEKIKIAVSTAVATIMTAKSVLRGSEKNPSTAPSSPPRAGGWAARRPWARDERRRTLGRSTCAMFLEERRPDMVDAGA